MVTSTRQTRGSAARRTAAIAGSVLLAAIAVTGCGGGDDKDASSPEDVTAALTEAKEAFDAETSVHFTLSTDAKPDGDAVLGAEGNLTTQPAFEGNVTVNYLGFKGITAPVVSVDGKVYVKLPTSPKFSELDPSTVGAPNPADFIDPEKGISGLLLEIQDAEQTDEKREGKKIVTTYTGTLSGDLVAAIIPSADKASDYETVVGLSDGELTTLQITGDFFNGSGDATFDLVFDNYGGIDPIKAP